MFLRRAFIMIVVCCLIPFVGFGQKSTQVRLRPESGGNVPFFINSLKQYNSGVEYLSWTRFDIIFEDSDDPLKTWNLFFIAKTMTLEGDYFDLPLEHIDVQVASASGTNPDIFNYVVSGRFPLTANPQVLIKDAPQGQYKVTISYYCGKPPSPVFLNSPPDYYNTLIEFVVEPSP